MLIIERERAPKKKKEVAEGEANMEKKVESSGGFKASKWSLEGKTALVTGGTRGIGSLPTTLPFHFYHHFFKSHPFILVFLCLRS